MCNCIRTTIPLGPRAKYFKFLKSNSPAIFCKRKNIPFENVVVTLCLVGKGTTKSWTLVKTFSPKLLISDIIKLCQTNSYQTEKHGNMSIQHTIQSKNDFQKSRRCNGCITHHLEDYHLSTIFKKSTNSFNESE